MIIITFRSCARHEFRDKIMKREQAFTEALEMYLKVRKLNTGKYSGMGDYGTYIFVQFHIVKDLNTVKKLTKELLKNADSETHSEIRRIGSGETLAVSFEWRYDDET